MSLSINYNRIKNHISYEKGITNVFYKKRLSFDRQPFIMLRGTISYVLVSYNYSKSVSNSESPSSSVSDSNSDS